MGEFGDAPLHELEKDLAGGRAVELFIDARGTQGASMEVSNDRAMWLGTNRARFRHVSLLSESCFIRITADFVRRFADLGEVMRIYTSPADFDAALRAALRAALAAATAD